VKLLITNYTFDASAQTITFTDYASILLGNVLLITNVTDNIIIYNFANSAIGGSVATNVLTLDYDTTLMSDTDKLQIWYEDTTAIAAGIGSLTETAPATDIASSALNGRLQRIAQRITSLITALGSPFQAGGNIGNTTFAATQSGTWTEANSATRLSESDFDTKTGSLTEAAPATDTASSGVNGRLQRIAQRISSLITAVGSPFQAGASIGNTSFIATQATAANLNVTEASAVAIKNAVETIDNFISGTKGLVTEDNSAAIKTSTELIDDAIVADDAAFTPAVTKVNMSGFTFDDVAPDSVNEGDAGAGRMSANRNQYVQIRDNAGNERGLNIDANGAIIVTQATAASLNVTEANSATRLSESDFDTKTGSLTETAPATDIASSGLNGRLQRIAQRITSLITALGSPFQAGGSIGNSSFGATQATAANLNMTEANSAAIKTSTELIDDTIATLGTTTYTEATTKGSIIGAVRRDANTTLVDTTNEVAPLQVNATGELKVAQIQALPAGTNAIGKLSANSGVVIGDVNIVSNIPGVAATSLGKAEDAVHGDGDTGVMALSVRKNTAAATSGADGDYQPLVTDTNGRLHVINSAGVAGDVANGSADSGNPVKVGMIAHTANPTAVADGQRVAASADKLGRQIVTIGQARDLVAQQTTTITTSTAETTVFTAVASTFLDIAAVFVTNTSATDVNVDFRDDTAGTIIFTIAAKAGTTAGATLTRPIKQTTVNKNWTAQCSASITSVKIFIQVEKNI
jgi:hypothetical protein